MNFGERAETVLGFLLEDIVEAYDKLRCIAAAVPVIHELKIPDLPSAEKLLADDAPQETEDFIAACVAWLRALNRELEVRNQHQTEFMHTISARQALYRKGDRKRWKIMETAVFKETIEKGGSGTFEFDLTDHFADYGPLSALRVKGVGVSYSGDDPHEHHNTLETLSAIVFAPRAVSPFDPAQSEARAPAIIADAMMSVPSMKPQMVYPRSMINLNPRGRWIVQTSVNRHHPTDSGARDERFRDIKLHLHLVARLSTDSKDWKDFWG